MTFRGVIFSAQGNCLWRYIEQPNCKAVEPGSGGGSVGISPAQFDRILIVDEGQLDGSDRRGKSFELNFFLFGGRRNCSGAALRT